MDNNNFLFDERPLIIQPELAALIGLNEAIVLQQLHYWLEVNRKANINFFEGRHWSYNSIREWQEKDFRFWSVDTVKRTFKSLVDKKIIRSGCFNREAFDKSKWYTIDYDLLRSLVAQSIGAKCTNGIEQNAPMEQCKLHQSEGDKIQGVEQAENPGNARATEVNKNVCSLGQNAPTNTRYTESTTETLVHQDHAQAFEQLWRLYPIKRGKGRMTDTKQKKLLGDYGYEQLARAIERYLREKQGKNAAYLMNGSTFFTSGFEDYLDKNYTVLPQRLEPLATVQDKRKDDSRAEIERRKKEMGLEGDNYEYDT